MNVGRAARRLPPAGLDWRSRLVLVSVAVTAVAVLLPEGSSLRLLAVLWFLLLCPGLALTPFLSRGDVLTEVTIAVALSIAIDAVVSMSLLYARVWRPMWGLLALMALCLGAVAVARARHLTGAAAPVTSRARRIDS